MSVTVPSRRREPAARTFLGEWWPSRLAATAAEDRLKPISWCGRPDRSYLFTFLARNDCGAVHSWPVLDFSKCPPPHRNEDRGPYLTLEAPYKTLIASCEPRFSSLRRMGGEEGS
jgi:hypothetical protein